MKNTIIKIKSILKPQIREYQLRVMNFAFSLLFFSKLNTAFFISPAVLLKISSYSILVYLSINVWTFGTIVHFHTLKAQSENKIDVNKTPIPIKYIKEKYNSVLENISNVPTPTNIPIIKEMNPMMLFDLLSKLLILSSSLSSLFLINSKINSSLLI